MTNFYDKWLSYWDQEQEERKKARKCIHEAELEWVRTKQDYKAALLCAPENGFATPGVTMLAEIPQGWNTGKHSHGEEAIYIVQGKGFSLVDGKSYQWEKDSCLFMPYGVEHQHFNTGKETVRYFSAMEIPLERFTGICKVVQHEEASETKPDKLAGIQKAESDIHPDYGRITLRAKDSPVISGYEMSAFKAKQKDEFTLSTAKEMRTAGLPWHVDKIRRLIDGNDFKAKQVHITGEFIMEPGMHTGKHAHGEALLYIVRGEGYSIVDGEKLNWKTGSIIHVQGPQTVHQHWFTGNGETHELRIHYGSREYFQPIYTKRVFPYLYFEFRGSDKK